MHRVDTQYADRLQEQLGILHYQAIDTGNGTIVTVTVFEDEEGFRRSEAAAARVREGLAELGIDLRSAASQVSVDGSSRLPDKQLRPEEGFDTTDEWLASFITSRIERGVASRQSHTLDQHKFYKTR